jgi:hypothetical protein
MPRVKYPGELGKPSTADSVVGKAITAAGGIDRETAERLYNAHWDRLVSLLFAHYGLTDSDDTLSKWIGLALRLTQDHVPAFQTETGRRPGRPRKRMSLAEACLKANQKGKRGRPLNEARRNSLKALITAVVDECRESKLEGRGSATRALKKICAAIAKHKGRNVHSVTQGLLPQWQRNLSEAKKFFPTIAAKLPK